MQLGFADNYWTPSHVVRVANIRLFDSLDVFLINSQLLILMKRINGKLKIFILDTIYSKSDLSKYLFSPLHALLSVLPHEVNIQLLIPN